MAATLDFREKVPSQEGYTAISDLIKRLGCIPLPDASTFEDLLQALGDCYGEHGVPPDPAPDMREGIKRDVFRSLEGIHDPNAGISAQTLAAFDDLLFRILSDVAE